MSGGGWHCRLGQWREGVNQWLAEDSREVPAGPEGGLAGAGGKHEAAGCSIQIREAERSTG